MNAPTTTYSLQTIFCLLGFSFRVPIINCDVSLKLFIGFLYKHCILNLIILVDQKRIPTKTLRTYVFSMEVVSDRSSYVYFDTIKITNLNEF